MQIIKMKFVDFWFGFDPYNEYRSFLEENGFDLMIEAIPEGWDMGNVLVVKKSCFVNA
jgi:hypothetical protein